MIKIVTFKKIIEIFGYFSNKIVNYIKRII